MRRDKLGFIRFIRQAEVGERECTRNHVASIHSILVLDEAKAIHELDLGDLAGAMSVEMGFNIGFGSCVMVSIQIRLDGELFQARRIADRRAESLEGDMN